MQSIRSSIVGTLLASLVLLTSTSSAQEPGSQSKPDGKTYAKQITGKFEKGASKEGLNYQILGSPKWNGSKRYPLIIWLHGGGQSGSENESQINGAGPRIFGAASNQDQNPSFVLAPQCPSSKIGWKDSVEKNLMALVGDLTRNLPIDRDRIYLIGQSMGGAGSWRLAGNHPDTFAAVVPICGYGSVRDAEKLKSIPIWAFHGDQDKSIPVTKSRDLVSAIKSAGGKKIKYSELAGEGHLIAGGVCNREDLCSWIYLQSKAAISDSISLLIDLDQEGPLSQDLYGANNECIFRPVWFDHGAYAEKYIAAGRPFFRFPGGTGSNFYNPVTGFFDDDSPSTRDYSGHNERIRKFTDGAGRVPDEYLKWVKKHDVSYSLVLNVCTQTFEQNKAWIEQLGREGHKVARIEIGNEVFYGGYKWAFDSGAEYAERAKDITAVIRKELPDAKVGVVIPNQLYQDERMLTDQRPSSLNHPYGWIKELKGQTFFDAVVMHVYSLTRMNNNTKPTDFIDHINGFQDCEKFLDSSMDRTLNSLEALFPGKAIWMTEFGVGGFGGNLKQYGLRYSHLGALHTDLMLLRFIKHPDVNVAHWHSFQHFFDFKGGKQGIGDDEHLNYTHFSLFKDAIRNCKAVVPVKLDVQGKEDPLGDVETVAMTGADNTYVMLLNRKIEERKIATIKIASSGKTSTPTLLEAVQLTHRSDVALADAMQDTERCDRVELDINQQSLTLPPYSITRLKLTRP